MSAVTAPPLNGGQPPLHPHPATVGQQSTTGKHHKHDSTHHTPRAPPTPAATASPSSSSTSMPLPSFVSSDPLSSDPDSSSSEDGFGRAKPAKPPRKSKSTGLPRPRPSYYYDAEYDPGTAGNKKRGRRGGYKGVPVFEPTMEDFEGNGGFYGYVKRIEKYGMRSGIVKVIPPKEWSDKLPSTLPPLRDIRLKEPIEQHMMGSQGLYRVTNVAKTRIWNAAQWKDLSLRDKWEGPDLLGEKEKGDRSERATASKAVLKRRREKAEAQGKGNGKGKGKEREEDDADREGDDEDDEDEDDEDAPKKGRRTPAKRAPPRRASKAGSVAETDADAASEPPPTPAQSEVKLEVVEVSDPTASASATPAPSASASAAAKSKRKTNLERANPTDDEWAAFGARFEELPHGMKKEDYTVEMMRDFERRYWRTLTFGEPPMYGADMAGSLFSDSTKAWNVAHLGDLLPLLAPKECSIPGVVSPYLYFGMWRATFAWHVEDADLYSINYIHFGAPKFWYSVPQEQAAKFERVMEGFFPTDFRKCHEFLRHKAFLASPRVLSNSGITLNRCAQLPGEFILTYPKGYHSGFNLGFNCAESINFATQRWLEIGKMAKACKCIDDSVNIDVSIWLREAAKAEALAKGEPWPYDDLDAYSSPPPEKPLAQPKKRMAMVTTGDAPRPAKKPKASAAAAANHTTGLTTAQGIPILSDGQKQHLAQLLQTHQGQLPPALQYLSAYFPQLYPHLYPPELSTPVAPPPPAPPAREENPYGRSSFVYQSQAVQSKPARAPSSVASTPAPTPAPAPAAGPVKAAPTPPPAKKAFVCALCPDLSEEGLVRVGEPGGKGSRKGEGLRAHRLCVVFTPATWIEEDPATGEELVRGFAQIEKARWKLKCQLCSEPHGTKIQCTKGKCTKAYHVSCAAKEDTGIFLDATVPSEEGAGGEVSVLDEAAGGGAEQKADAAALSSELLHLTVLCRTHNPNWQLLEAERKAAELKAKVEALAPSSRIRVKTTRGVFDVVLDKVDYEGEAVSFIFDDGKRNSVKWKLIVWPEDPELARKKQEKAQKAQRDKAAAMDRPAYKTSGKRHSTGPPAAAPSVAPAPQPQAAPPVQSTQPHVYAVPQGAPQQPQAQAQGQPLQRAAYPYAAQQGAPPPGYGPGPSAPPPHGPPHGHYASPYPTPPTYGYSPQPQYGAPHASQPAPAGYHQPYPPAGHSPVQHPAMRPHGYSPAAAHAQPPPQAQAYHPHPHPQHHAHAASPYASPVQQRAAPPFSSYAHAVQGGQPQAPPPAAPQA
ncbi:hypothetical protein JCM10207_009254 [Rhodosporidiobolus poonsookiae]